MSISENHEQEDKIVIYKPNYPLNPWVIKVLETSDGKHADMILKAHDVTVTLIMKQSGKIDSSDTPMYRNFYSQVLDKQGYKVTEEFKVEPGVTFTLYNPNDELKFKKEKKPYRRNRKKINYINNKTLLEVILDSGEENLSKGSLHTLTIRKSADSNPNKDKEIYISNLIFNLLVNLNPYCSPKLNENYSVMLDEFYVNLMNDISLTKEDEVYTKQNLIKFITANRQEQVELCKSLYAKIYAKVKLPLSKSPNKSGEVVLNIRKEPKEIIELYKMKDVDMTRLLNRLDYLDLTKVL